MGGLSVSSMVVTMLSAALTCNDASALLAPDATNYTASDFVRMASSLQSTLADAQIDFVYTGSLKHGLMTFARATNLSLPKLTSSRCLVTSAWAATLKSGRRKKKLKNSSVLFPCKRIPQSIAVPSGTNYSVASIRHNSSEKDNDTLQENPLSEFPPNDTCYNIQNLDANVFNSSAVPSQEILYSSIPEQNVTRVHGRTEEQSLTTTGATPSIGLLQFIDKQIENINLNLSLNISETILENNTLITVLPSLESLSSDEIQENNTFHQEISEKKELATNKPNQFFYTENALQTNPSVALWNTSNNISSKTGDTNEPISLIASIPITKLEIPTEVPLRLRTPLPKTCITTTKRTPADVSQPSTSKLIREEELNADSSTRSFIKLSREDFRTRISETGSTSEAPELGSEGEYYTENRSALLFLFKQNYPIELWKSKGFFTDDFYDYIHTHWLRFPPQQPSTFYIFAAAYCAIMTVGMLGNSLVIFMFIRCRSLRTPANILVMNLAVSDFFLLSKMPLFIYNCLYRGPVLGYFGCQIFGFVGGLTGTVSIATLAAISLDRYYVIVCPLDAARRTTKRRARLCVLFSWLYGTLFSSIPFIPHLGLGAYVPEGFLVSCSFDYLDPSVYNRIYIFSFFVAAWVLPFCIITTCYVGICRVVASARANPGNDSGRHEKHRTELRLAVVVFFVIGLWFLAWTPYAVVALLGIAGQKQLISPLTSMVPAIFCKTASCMDPYVYAVTHPRFRLEFATLVGMRVGSQKKKKDERKRKIHKVRMKQPRAWTVTETTSHPQSEWSDEDVEEVEVIVGGAASLSSLSSEEDEERKKWASGDNRTLWDQGASVFPMTDALNRKLQPPSWFVAPKSKCDRSSSLKYKTKQNKRCPKSV